MPTAGYSGTPLAKKLGITAGATIAAIDAPKGYARLVAPLPAGVRLKARIDPAADIIHLFADRKSALAEALASCRETVRPDAAIWVSWPKKASKVPTDITEDVIREVALPMGLVDIKVCAVDDTWSGLKLVIRKELRKAQSPRAKSQRAPKSQVSHPRSP
jgi:hypothetical protein